MKPPGRVIEPRNETRALETLRPDPRNARLHSSKQIANIAASIRRFGFVSPIVIRPDGQLIGGHATLQALQSLGRVDCDCRVVDGLSEAEYSALAIALNRLPETSAWDDDVLRETLASLHAAGDPLDALGFDNSDLAKLLDQSEADAVEVREIASGPVTDEFWISVRGPLAQQAKALARLRAVMAELDRVSVELGVISTVE